MGSFQETTAQPSKKMGNLFLALILGATVSASLQLFNPLARDKPTAQTAWPSQSTVATSTLKDCSAQLSMKTTTTAHSCAQWAMPSNVSTSSTTIQINSATSTGQKLRTTSVHTA